MSYLGRSAKLSLKAQEKVSFLATAGQTVKTGLSYTPSFIEVYVNGVLLTDTTDFTATNGNSITFTVALLLNDEVTVISLKTFTVADHYSKTEADTLLAAKATNTALATTNTAVALKAPIASPVFTGNVTVSASGADAVRTLSLQGTNGSSEVYQFNLVADGGNSAAKFMVGSGGGTPTERMRIDGSGNVSVGTNTTGKIELISAGVPYIDVGHITGTGSGYAYSVFRYNSTIIGRIDQNGTTGVSYSTSSDYRLKTDVQPMTGATDRVKLLKPCNFEWIADGTRVDGFIAHEAQEVVPESVVGTKDAMMDEEYEVTPAVLDDEGNETTAQVMGTRSVPDMQGIDQAKLVPLLTATIQELIARIEALEGE
jgi:hypothetical protein